MRLLKCNRELCFRCHDGLCGLLTDYTKTQPCPFYKDGYDDYEEVRKPKKHTKLIMYD